MVFAPSSIGYYLHYSVTFHFIERKSIIHCTNIDGCFQASMIWGRTGGEHLYMLFQWMPHYQALGVKRKRKPLFSNTPMHTDCILIILFLMFLFFNVGAGPQRADTAVSDKPKALKAHIHIQLSV